VRWGRSKSPVTEWARTCMRRKRRQNFQLGEKP
jgi:hypothetical protein